MTNETKTQVNETNVGFDFSKFEAASWENVGQRDFASNQQTITKPSVKQIETYLNLCKQKNQEVENYHLMSRETLSEKIQELYRFYPASDKQKQIIREKIAGLQAIIQMPTMPEKDLNKLSGGLNGTASSLIEKLISIEKEHNVYATKKITEGQLNMIVPWMICFEIDFESVGISRKIDLGNDTWRRPTPIEFAKQIYDVFNLQSASEFIEKNRTIWYEWSATRIRPQQIKYVRDLENKMSDLSKGIVVEWAVDQQGNWTQVKTQKQPQYNPRGFAPMADVELRMMSQEDANTYINMLKKDLANKELVRYGEQSDASLTLEMLRTTNTPEEARLKDFEALQDLLFKLEAIAGYSCEECHDAVSSLMVDEVKSSDVLTAETKIKEFIKFLITEDYTDLETLAELAKDSKTAQRIILS